IRTAGLTAAAVVLPPDAPLIGYIVSPISGRIALAGRPNVSAAITAIIVRVPVPRSWVPTRTTTRPSEEISQRACDGPRPPPPHVLIATPMPVLIGPGVGSPVAWRLAHPNSSAPLRRYERHIAFGASGGRFLIRNSTGSILTRSASSSISTSVMKEPCG